MRNFSELSEAEIRALTSDEVVHFIKVGCMESGVKLLAKPEEVVIPVFEKTLTAYKVDGMDGYVLTMEEAEKLQKALQGVKVFNSNWHSNYKNLEHQQRETTAGISQQLFYDDVTGKQVDEVEAKLKPLRDAYEKALKEWKENDGLAGAIRDEIWGKFHSVREKYDRLDEMAVKFAEYFILAKQDYAEAEKYFAKAFSPTPEELDYIKGNYEKTVADEKALAEKALKQA